MPPHTHIGHQRATNYQHRSTRLFGHTLPARGKTHALVRDTAREARFRGTGMAPAGELYRGLCGVPVVGSDRDEFGTAVPPNVWAVAGPAAGRVGCKRCRAKIAAA